MTTPKFPPPPRSASTGPDAPRVRVHATAVGEDNLGRDEIVDGHSVAPALMGDSAAEREARHTGLGHDRPVSRAPGAW